MVSAAYRFFTVLSITHKDLGFICSVELVPAALTQWKKAQMQIIGNILAFQRVFMGQIDRSGVSKGLLRNRTAIIERK